MGRLECAAGRLWLRRGCALRLQSRWQHSKGLAASDSMSRVRIPPTIFVLTAFIAAALLFELFR